MSASLARWFSAKLRTTRFRSAGRGAFGPDDDSETGGCPALGLLDDERVIQPLISALSDTHEDVRAAAAYQIGIGGDRSVTGVLINTLNDPSSVVVRGAGEGLAVLMDSRAVEPLIGTLMRADDNLARGLVEVVCKFRDKRVVPALIALVRGRSRTMPSRVAAIALAKLDPTSAVEPVSEMLDDDDEDARWCALQALRLTKDRACGSRGAYARRSCAKNRTVPQPQPWHNCGMPEHSNRLSRL